MLGDEEREDDHDLIQKRLLRCSAVHCDFCMCDVSLSTVVLSNRDDAGQPALYPYICCQEVDTSVGFILSSHRQAPFMRATLLCTSISFPAHTRSSPLPSLSLQVLYKIDA